MTLKDSGNKLTFFFFGVSVAALLLGLGSAGYFYIKLKKIEDSQTRALEPISIGEGSVNPNIFVGLSNRIVPSVVNISTVSNIASPFGDGPNSDLFKKFWERFFNSPEGAPQIPKNRKATALGSGFVIEGGLILTNNHVVAEADEIKVRFTEDVNEKPTDGEVVGRDPELDLALVKVKTDRQLRPLVFGNSDELQVGEYVIAVGNPFGQGHSVTHGIISAKGRQAPGFVLANYIQTDAPINPGNSGGPLVNLRGEVIGINNAIDARAQGIGFAIPVDLVKKVLPQLKNKGAVSRGYIGVLVNELTPKIAEQLELPDGTKGPFVAHVYPGAPAEKAGLKPYDVIQKVDGTKILDPSDLVKKVVTIPVGETVPIEVLRKGKKKNLKITIGKRPSQEGSQKKKKKEKSKKTIDLGMQLKTLTREDTRALGIESSTRGVLITQMSFGGYADRANLRKNDVILEVGQTEVTTVEKFYELVNEKGKTYLLRILRPNPSGKTDLFDIKILELKDD